MSFEHAIKLLREQAPTLSHEGRRDALDAAELLEATTPIFTAPFSLLGDPVNNDAPWIPSKEELSWEPVVRRSE